MTRARRRGGRDRNEELPTAAAALIEALFAHRPVGAELRHYQIVVRWSSLVGKRIAARTWPQLEKLDRGVLPVLVSSSTWMHELSFAKQELIANINAGLGDPPLVTEIRLVLGSPKQSLVDTFTHAQRLQRRPPLASAALPSPATGAALQRINRETEGIEDDELREIIRASRRALDL